MFDLLSTSTLTLLILFLLEDRKWKGHELRKRLGELKYRKSPGAFYQAMDRLVDLGLVEGELGERGGSVPGLIEKTYGITGAGISALREYRELVGNKNQLGFGI